MASIHAKRQDGKVYYYVVAKDPGKGRRGQRWIYAGTDSAQAEIRLREVELSVAKGESLRRKGESSIPCRFVGWIVEKGKPLWKTRPSPIRTGFVDVLPSCGQLRVGRL